MSNTRLRRKKPWTLDLLAARRAAIADPLRWCEQMLRESESPATVASLQKQCWSRGEEIAGALEKLRLEKTGGLHDWRRLIHGAVLQSLAENILAAVQTFHTANPQRAGLSHETSNDTQSPSRFSGCGDEITAPIQTT